MWRRPLLRKRLPSPPQLSPSSFVRKGLKTANLTSSSSLRSETIFDRSCGREGGKREKGSSAISQKNAEKRNEVLFFLGLWERRARSVGLSAGATFSPSLRRQTNG